MVATPPRALTIAGSDSGGGAGVQADLRTFFAAGVHGSSALTAVTVQNSRGVAAFEELSPDLVGAQITAVLDDIGAAVIKTGMLASARIIEAVADTLGAYGDIPLVVDPVAASKHGYALMRDDALDMLRNRLVPMATIVTPNLGEARLLTGLTVRDHEGQVEAARRLHALGPDWVLVKGGHFATGDATDVLFDGDKVTDHSMPRSGTPHTHGAGDTIAAAIAAGIARGLPVPEAVAAGKRYVSRAIRESYPLGAGIGPVGHFWRLAPPDR